VEARPPQDLEFSHEGSPDMSGSEPLRCENNSMASPGMVSPIRLQSDGLIRLSFYKSVLTLDCSDESLPTANATVLQLC